MTTETGTVTNRELGSRGGDLARSLQPLAVDVGLPLGSYYLLHAGFGVSVWAALVGSSVIPAGRAAAGLLTSRSLNLLAALMLLVNVAGIVVNLLTGDPRAMIAKDSLVSSVIGIAILASVAARRPLMTAGLKPYLTRGVPERIAAWDRLAAGSARFRRLELAFSIIWGVVLLADCAVRLVGAYTLPVTTMVWLSTVLTLGAIGVGMMAGGIAAGPMLRMLETRVRANTPCPR